MLRVLLTSSLFFCILLSNAQQFKDLPAFGNVTKQELEMKACEFESGAAAMVIFSEAESFFRINSGTATMPFFEQTDYRIRIKIFNAKGFDESNIKIKYPSEDKSISIKQLSAQTFNLDAAGNIVATKLDKASVFNKKLNKRYSEMSFAFPDVKEGSIIELKYVLDNASIGEWYFQKNIPVAYSRFILNFPQELEVTVAPRVSLPMQKGESTKKGMGNYSWYYMENIPGLGNEPYMSCREDYLQKLDTRITAVNFMGQPRRSFVRTWPGVIKSLVDDEDFGKQLKKEIPRTADLGAALKTLNDPFKKMTYIHTYVRNNMEWNGYYSIWALDGVKAAWKDKKGTTGEINLILINLLKDAGLNALPLLVSTKDNGLINTAVAGIDQFNKVMAHVTIGDKFYVLDATEKQTPSSLIPLDVMLTEGLLIAKQDSYQWGWKTLWNENTAYDRSISLNVEADTLGNLKGAAILRASQYERCKLLPDGKKSIGALQTSFKGLSQIKIDSITVENAELDSLPIIENIYFESKGSSSGAYKYFTVNLFTGLDKNIFLAEERTTDVFFGANQHYEINGIIFLPDGYTLEEPPKSVKLVTPDGAITFKRQSTFSSGIINISYRIDFKKALFGAQEYADFREFYKKMLSMLNERFVYRKEQK
jgi:hypothetical protein